MWVTTIGPHCLHVAAGKKKIHSGSKEKKIFCVRCNGISGDATPAQLQTFKVQVHRHLLKANWLWATDTV